jgi:deoxyribonuclease-4
MLLGAHLSIAGGLEQALLLARQYRFKTLAMFVRNQRQRRVPRLAEQTVKTFRATRNRLGISPVVAHGSYLVNLAAETDVRARSIDAVREDLFRCKRLGIEYLVIHPGSHADIHRGVRLIAAALDVVLKATLPRPPRILLETTAGAGHQVGKRFEELVEILALLHRPEHAGVCLDTCHVFAAGYDVRTEQAYQATMGRFEKLLGLDRLFAIHVNDSVGELGSQVDRHTHIGRGKIGLKGFVNFVNDPRLAAIPFILETPKGKTPSGRDWDSVNAAALRRLVRGRNTLSP